MIEFKQIIGRGTRVAEEYGKTHFTIMDFRNATNNFADPDFDGEPVQIYVAKGDDDVIPPDPGEEDDTTIDYTDHDPEQTDITFPTGVGEGGGGGGSDPRIKYVVNDVAFTVSKEQIQHLDADGKLITESLRDYTRKKVTSEFASLDAFLQNWTATQKKSILIDQLESQGVFFEALAELVGRDYDAFDLICHVAYGQKPMTRKERANNVKKRDVFTKYGEQARAVLSLLLDKYANQGLAVIEKMDVLKVDPLDELGTPIEIVKFFGGKEQYLAAIRELEANLYQAAV
ncbi:hypothetical protein N9Y42_08055 [Mariniblastus sp.]|nr:hypothetical protein [Mariniblastus sp.]